MSKSSKEDRLVMEELERKRKRLQEKELKKNSKLKKKNNSIYDNDYNNVENYIKAQGNQAGKENKKNNNEIMKTTILFAVIFFSMVGYYAYMVTFNSESIVNNSYNSRLEGYAEINVRGNIYTSSGKVIAETKIDEAGQESRIYPYDELFAHVVGMNSHGKTGIEKAYNYYMLTTNINPIQRMFNEFRGKKNIGNDVVTTLNLNLQKAAYESLGKYHGAAIVLDSNTGKILSMVSKPDYNPNKLEELWSEVEDEKGEESFLLNRATQGLYTPGSVFKIFTTLEYMRQDMDYKNFLYECSGSDTFANYKINCYNKTRHGEESLTEAFANSCNGAFATIATKLNQDKFYNNMNSLLFNAKLPISLEYSKSSFDISDKSSIFDITQTSIGQGKTLMTPIHMAMIVQAIANNGKMLVPYVVSEIDGSNGAIVEKYEPQEYGQIMTKKEAMNLQEFMNAVTEYGTGKILAKSKYQSAGKTGTAQIDSNNNINSWFVGYAKKGKKNITVCVVIENVPDGSIKAVECAKEIFDSYFE